MGEILFRLEGLNKIWIPYGFILCAILLPSFYLMFKWKKQKRGKNLQIERCSLRSFINGEKFTLGYYLCDGKLKYVCYLILDNGKYEEILFQSDVTFATKENAEVEFIRNRDGDHLETILYLPKDYVLKDIQDMRKKHKKEEIERYLLRSFANGETHAFGYYLCDGKLKYVCYPILESGKLTYICYLIFDNGKYQKITFVTQEDGKDEFIKNGEVIL